MGAKHAKGRSPLRDRSPTRPLAGEFIDLERTLHNLPANNLIAFEAFRNLPEKKEDLGPSRVISTMTKYPTNSLLEGIL